MKFNRGYMVLAGFCVLTLGYQNCGSKMNFSPDSNVAPTGSLVSKQSTENNNTNDSTTTSCETLEAQADNTEMECIANSKDDNAKQKICNTVAYQSEDKIEDACENDDQDKDDRFGVLCIIMGEKDNRERIKVDQDEKIAFLETGESIPHSVCMSPRACLVIVNDYLNQVNGVFGTKPNVGASDSSQIQYTRFQENGVCRHNKHIVHLSDDQMKMILNNMTNN